MLGTVAEPRWAPDGRRLAWVQRGTGGTELVVARADGSGRPTVAAEPAGARGGTFAWVHPGRLVVAVADGGLRVVAADGGESRPLDVVRGRAAAPAVSSRGLVAFVDETDDACVIAVAPLDGTRPARVVAADADFAWDPAWSPDGRLLAWQEWDFPAMPWDASRVVLARPDGTDRVVVAGGPAEAAGQPRFAPVGRTRLAFVSDRSGWANVVVAEPGATPRALAPVESREHAEPSWSPGQRSFAWSPDGRGVAWCRNEDGFGRLVVGTVDRAVTERFAGWHRWLDWGPAGIACVRSGARTVPAVVVVAPDGGARRVHAATADDGLAAAAVEPRPVTVPDADDGPLHALVYEPVEPERPTPLVVDVHGGPNDQAIGDWSARVQRLVARGWTVLAPNYRGSTGYGRAYTQALTGAWGVVDVADTVATLRAAPSRGWGDGRRVALTGRSAGGFTALLAAAAAPELVRAVATAFPVTDLVALVEGTHRFESRALDRLVGVLPDALPRYRERSPVTRAGDLRARLLVLQGDADPVVPAAATSSFVEAVRAAGGVVDLHVYAGEGHGWSRPETAADALDRTEGFLTTMLERAREAPRPGG